MRNDGRLFLKVLPTPVGRPASREFQRVNEVRVQDTKTDKNMIQHRALFTTAGTSLSRIQCLTLDGL